jgi:hypothetical protein
MTLNGKIKKRLFTVKTPLGYSVYLTRDRWRTILRTKHPALEGNEKKIRICLKSPVSVRESAKDSDVHMFYREEDGIYLCVVATPANEKERFVVTAYFTKNIKKGTQLWPS